MKKFILAGLLLSTANFSFSEDIELYISDSVKEAKTRPQVLIVFDTSGSMGWNTTVKAAYKPATNYDAITPYTKLSGNHIYYAKGQIDISDIPIADNPDEKRKFSLDISNCKVAQDLIEQYGFYTGHVREYNFQGNSGRWAELNETDGTGIYITDCEDDVLGEDNNNKNYLSAGAVTGLSAGYPIDGEGELIAPEFYTTSVGDSNVEWTGSLVTLYSDNYLRWHHGDVENEKIGLETRPRIDIAQESVTSLINSSPNVDFGLQVFNRNNSGSSRHGGRIVSAIAESTSASHNALVDVVNDDLIASGNTPLCETLYEASRYFGGKSVDFGDNETSFTPSRDLSAEDPVGTYDSPFTSCSDKAYVILMTDGVPTSDNNADDKVKALGTADSYAMSPFDDNYLAAIAGWMNNNDVNESVDGKQTVSTYTIGFSSGATAAAPLLTEAALLGGGKYFPATDTASLTAALTNVLANLEPSNNSLSSSSVGANNFDRTETLNTVYYSMFQPDRGPRWQGNVKKYEVVGEILAGKDGEPAINVSTGHFSSDVKSFWSTTIDGNKVAEGGVAEMLRNKSNRVIYSDIKGDKGDSLDEFTLANLIATSNVYTSKSVLAAKLGVDESNVGKYIEWAQGIDVDDEDDDGETDDMRYDVFGDPLHSKPLVINYGEETYLVVGTNAGALHMFEDKGDTVDETWAFMPREFFPKIKSLRNNSTSDDKVYGVDGKITSYIDDKNGDGVIQPGDTVWIFFGLRRGGTSYYALDISDPDIEPTLLWHIDAETLNFGELGQSWSQPKVGFSKLNIVSEVAKPVLFFGGGYDTSKDTVGVYDEKDNVGRAIYMVDAETGTLKWSMASEDATTTFSGDHSIPSSIATLDSDGDGLVDRLYAGDTGGNVWRVDMPSYTSADFSVFQLASLGGDTASNDRRFFNEPVIVRTFITETIESEFTDADYNTSTITVHQEIPYDAILLGSGNRSHPLRSDTNDSFFMIKDKNVVTQTFPSSGTPSIPIPTLVTKSTLFDITDNPIDNESDETELTKLKVELSSASGWYFDLEQIGEKNTASALVINNAVIFTTFTPPNFDEDQEGCEIPTGQSWLYAVDLAQGTKKFDWAEEYDTDRPDTIIPINDQYVGKPTIIVIDYDDGDAETIDETKGYIDIGGQIKDPSFTINTLRSYLYVTEDK